jgi:hypothetical protein
VVRCDDCGAAQMRESDGWRNEDLREDRRKIGPARAIAFSPRGFWETFLDLENSHLSANS